MGVDLQTYRAKIGTFRHSVGTDVLTIVCYVNFSGGLKSVGSVVFIGILLLIAGIESNPGPKDDVVQDALVAKQHDHKGYEDQAISKPTAIEITGLPENIDEGTLESIFENKKRLGGGPVKKIVINPSTLSGVIEFEEAEAVEIVLSKIPITILQKTVDIKIHDVNETLSSSDQTESSRLDDGSDEYFVKSEEINNMIHTFGLEKYMKEKIRLRDALFIDYYETETSRHYAIKDLPLLILKKLMNSNSGALDTSDYKLENEADKSISRSSEDCAVSKQESANKTFNISQLDLFVLAFQSCHPDLKQILCQKLYLCKLAIPFLYYDACLQKSVVSVWPLRSVVIQSNVITKETVTTAEYDVLQMPTYIVTFARFGRTSYSKSKLLNSILSGCDTNTFFNEDCVSGSVPKKFANGYAEIFWVPAVADINSKIPTPLTYLNLRGDISRHFSDQHLSLFSSLSDILVLCVDQAIVSKSADILQKQFSKFHYVLLIVNNPNSQCNEREIENRFKVESETKQIEYRFNCVLTHSDSRNKINLTKIRNDVSQYIYNYITSNTLNLKPIPLENRLSLCPPLALTDETQDCEHAKDIAEEVFKAMNKVSLNHNWLETVTPVQSIYSKRLCGLLKDLHSSKQISDEIENKLVKVRTKQINTVTTIIKQFIDYLNSFADQPITMHYFLTWLKTFIEREQRQTVSQLKGERTELENQCLLLDENKPSNPDTLKSIEQKLKEVEDKLEKSNFGISNLFREIAHIYDAVIILQTTPDSSDLPSVEYMINIFANLFVNGYIIEFLDSCSLYMPMAFIKTVLNKVHNIIDKKKVLSLSVIGLQSSGKSTLLNTMFGVHNPTRSGRCTRGIMAQLVPISSTTTTKENEFDYVLVLDTEGLRAPELKEEIYKRDNKIATMITGLGDISIINIMGENTTEIRDVLQANVHAFLRLHLSNPNVDIKKRCMFIHQNVADEAALENMRTGLKSSVELLDMATKEAAESEGISSIKKFDQVIAFKMKSDVKCMPHLWQGNPPMATVNQKYCQKVLLTRQYFLKIAHKELTKSYKTLEDVAVSMDDLWTGVLSEDFVFTFRNSLEKKAYSSLEKILKENIWDIELRFEQYLHDICKKSFSKCESEKKILEEETHVISTLKPFIMDEHNKALNKLNQYFSHNEYQELTIQWKQKTIIQLQTSVDDIFMKRQSVVQNFVRRKLVEIKLQRLHSNTAQKLYQISINLASKLKDKNLDISEIDSEFDKIWESVVKNFIDTADSSPKCNLRPIFIDWLYSTFTEHPVLNRVLEQKKMLKSTPDVEHLTDTFSITGIDNRDFDFNSVIGFKTEKPSSEDMLKKVKEMLNYVFREVDESMIKYKQIDNEVTEGDIRKFLFEFQKSTEFHFERKEVYIVVNTAFKVKLFVHICHIVCHVFEQHNNRYQDTHGITAQLQEYKRQCKDLFNAHLCERRTETTASDCFRNIVESFLNNLIQDRLPMLTKEELKPLLPSSKMNLIFKLLRDLVEQNDFESSLLYINRPSKVAQKWVTEKCQIHLFSNNNSIFRKLVLHEIQNYCDDLYEVVGNSEHVLAETVNIDEWVDFFNNNVKHCSFSAEDFQMLKVQFVNNSRLNVKLFKSNLLEQMKKVQTNIESYLQSVTQDTVRWRGYIPYDELFKELWGCNEQCMFCGEPCMHETDGHAADHECLQHRPKGLIGNGFHVSNESREITLQTCSYDVATNKESACSVFGYACSKQTKTDCPKHIHKFREYKRFIETWDIKPDKKTKDKLFWQWFISNYKENLEEQYSYRVSNVPSKWSKISQIKAIENLEHLYRK